MAKAPTVAPMRGKKSLVVVRHGQGYHNVLHEAEGGVEHHLHDARLTERGWSQARACRHHMLSALARDSKALPESHFELVVVSPLTRAIETACGIFSSGREPAHPGDVLCTDPRMSRSGAPPIVAHEACREAMGDSVWDSRSSRSELSRRFPGVDLTHLDADEDEPFAAWGTVREGSESRKERAGRFLSWLRYRPERTIAIVSHAGFLHALMNHHLHPDFGNGNANDNDGNFFPLMENCQVHSLSFFDPLPPPSTNPLDWSPGSDL